MVQSASANYTTANNQTFKSPVYAVLIDGITDCFVFTSGAFLNSYTAGTVYKTGSPKGVSGTQKTIMPEHGYSSISTMTLTITDIDSRITTQLSKLTPYLDGSPRQVKIFAGYDTINFGNMVSTGDALQIYTGMITGVKLPKIRGPYSITIQDVQQVEKKNIFTLITEVSPLWLQGNPYTLLLQVLTSTGLGTNGAYDVLAAENGLAIPQAMINISAIEAERNLWYGAVEFRFKIIGKEIAKDWIEKEILKPINAHIIIGGDGRLSVRSIRPIIGSTSGLPAITNADIVGDITYDRNIEGVINTVIFEYDYDPATNNYMKRAKFEDLTSLFKYKDAKPLTIQSKGLRGTSSSTITGFTDLGADNLVQDRARRIFQRYGYPAQIINFTTLFDKHLMEEGDIFLLTHAEIPSEVDTMGITNEPMEVISKDVLWADGLVKWGTLDYFPNSNAKYALFGPPTLLTYTAESTANKNTYAFFARWNGTMSNGDAGYNFL